MSLGAGAYALGELPGGLGTVILLALINLIVQPLSPLLFVAGAEPAYLCCAARTRFDLPRAGRVSRINSVVRTRRLPTAAA